ncbi:hypothetical protein PPERSA_05372 [Pseudocohnilembus persalinus]|uniref:RING-CH-type domain-containing protein n=1 Tax=Pseudocohnilembus persalinus TaxID=266149 RepID=A0A0V0R8L3_PSEPJ|nr:hypothetical protein PPERSA_05372 [Pseudocohnilembus persalinus]|eukprot:KRX10552.1 hypothetical protein PPERSA_05372 [Pseudocohnilembus persalinus]
MDEQTFQSNFQEQEDFLESFQNKQKQNLGQVNKIRNENEALNQEKTNNEQILKVNTQKNTIQNEKKNELFQNYQNMQIGKFQIEKDCYGDQVQEVENLNTRIQNSNKFQENEKNQGLEVRTKNQEIEDIYQIQDKYNNNNQNQVLQNQQIKNQNQKNKEDNNGEEYLFNRNKKNKVQDQDSNLDKDKNKEKILKQLENQKENNQQNQNQKEQDFILNENNNQYDECWICQQEVKEKRGPVCLCKGSLANVHRWCLNRWIYEKYQGTIKEIIQQQELNEIYQKSLEIICPNCKYPYKFNFREKTVVKTFRDIKFFDSKDKILLFLLFSMQVVALIYDFFVNSSYYINYDPFNYNSNFVPPNGQIVFNHDKNGIQNGKSQVQYFEDTTIDWIHTIHIVSVCILLGAAGFNIWDVLRYNIEIEILDLEENKQNKQKKSKKVSKNNLNKDLLNQTNELYQEQLQDIMENQSNEQNENDNDNINDSDNKEVSLDQKKKMAEKSRGKFFRGTEALKFVRKRYFLERQKEMSEDEDQNDDIKNFKKYPVIEI